MDLIERANGIAGHGPNIAYLSRGQAESVRNVVRELLKELKELQYKYDCERDLSAILSGRPALDIPKLADRLMGWPIPVSVVSDRCMSEPNYKFPRHGTCIMGPEEARQMLEYLFSSPA